MSVRLVKAKPSIRTRIEAKKLEKCPKCGSKNIEKKWGAEIDPGDPSTIEVQERAIEWDIEYYRIKCLDCGYEYEVENQPGYRE